MLAPVCVKCGLTMRIKRNGQPVVFCTDYERQSPHHIRHADTYRCPECGALVAVGMGSPIEHSDVRFARELDAAGDDAVRVY